MKNQIKKLSELIENAEIFQREIECLEVAIQNKKEHIKQNKFPSMNRKTANEIAQCRIDIHKFQKRIERVFNKINKLSNIKSEQFYK